jgi:ADP-ribose pyrophosphatase
MTSDWKTLQSDLIYQDPWIKLYQDKVKTRSGKTMQYTWYKSSDVAVIVPFLREDALLMIRQYRYPLRKVLLEFPAGHVENTENPMKTAKRELLEETGYIAKEIQHFYTYHPSISKSRQLVHIFRAKHLVEYKSNHDGTEDITGVEIVSIEQLKHMIKQRKIESAGTLIAYLVCCAGIII